jgi:hypothetical protein
MNLELWRAELSQTGPKRFDNVVDAITELNERFD